ncbi:GDSL-type esterase/lipase family protein [Candidatus Electronema sp. JM]|uniref:GDSL-type esterase/lipase family protein n=1 Tax=Candidatus Electronema sp. JM TaxID=3401571 RepID=UPI003AA88BC6
MMADAKKTIMLLGDSLAEWGDWAVLLPELDVINRGKAGECVEELSARLADELDTMPEPDFLLLMSGTNNLLMGSPHFTAVFQTMLPRVAALCPGSRIVVNGIMPMRCCGLTADLLGAVNKELQAYAERSGCAFLDMTEPFAASCLPVTRPCFLHDGVHLSTLGYQVWAREIRNLTAAATFSSRH